MYVSQLSPFYRWRTEEKRLNDLPEAGRCRVVCESGLALDFILLHSAPYCLSVISVKITLALLKSPGS